MKRNCIFAELHVANNEEAANRLPWVSTGIPH
jgi:hypothetical protein